MRPSGRELNALRSVSIEVGMMKHAEGSCLIKMGDTHVLCSASIEDKPPPFLKGSGLGWVTAEYGMLPRATNSRTKREAAAGRQSGRTQEIQRLIGRALRAGVDRSALGERQIVVDCDVIQADGGTRCASITGGCGASAGDTEADEGGGDHFRPDLGPCRGGVLRDLCGADRPGSGLRRGFGRRDRWQFRDDRQGTDDRGADVGGRGNLCARRDVGIA